MDGFLVTDLLIVSGASSHHPPPIPPSRVPSLPCPYPTLAYRQRRPWTLWLFIRSSLTFTVSYNKSPARTSEMHPHPQALLRFHLGAFLWSNCSRTQRHNLDLWGEKPHSHSTVKIRVKAPGLRGNTFQRLLNFKELTEFQILSAMSHLNWNTGG